MPLKLDRFSDDMLGDLVGAGADRLFVHALWADFGIILVRVDDDRAGQVFDGGRERPLGLDPDLEFLDLLRFFNPVDVLLGGGLVGDVGGEIQRVDDVIGVELLAVVEFYALAQFQLQRAVVDPLP